MKYNIQLIIKNMIILLSLLSFSLTYASNKTLLNSVKNGYQTPTHIGIAGSIIIINQSDSPTTLSCPSSNGYSIDTHTIASGVTSESFACRFPGAKVSCHGMDIYFSEPGTYTIDNACQKHNNGG